MTRTGPPIRAALGLVLLIGGLALLFGRADPCEAPSYPDAAGSPYRLPWPEGSRRVHQGNCDPDNTHRGDAAFAYDFSMPIGSPVSAARAGVVVGREDRWSDDDHDPAHGNRIVLRHEDGSYALYGHLTRGGARVGLGEAVAQGQEIARSGSSGLARAPHLHFMVFSCEVDVGERRLFCASEPVRFADGPEAELVEGGEVPKAAR